jgi:hypothetical protein
MCSFTPNRIGGYQTTVKVFSYADLRDLKTRIQRNVESFCSGRRQRQCTICVVQPRTPFKNRRNQLPVVGFGLGISTRGRRAARLIFVRFLRNLLFHTSHPGTARQSFSIFGPHCLRIPLDRNSDRTLQVGRRLLPVSAEYEPDSP